jgi:hypothetical protein
MSWLNSNDAIAEACRLQAAQVETGHGLALDAAPTRPLAGRSGLASGRTDIPGFLPTGEGGKTSALEDALPGHGLHLRASALPLDLLLTLQLLGLRGAHPVLSRPLLLFGAARSRKKRWVSSRTSLAIWARSKIAA